MKRFLTATLLALFSFTLIYVPPPPAEAGPKISSSVTVTHVSGQDSSGATVTPVSATAGSTIHVFKYSYHVNGADNITLSCGTTSASKSKYTFSAETGVVITPYPMYLECDTGTALTLTKGTAGTLLEYDIWYVKDLD